MQQAQLIDILATRRAKQGLSTFLIAQVDNDAQVRRAAMNGIGQLGDPKWIQHPCGEGTNPAGRPAEGDHKP